MAIGKTNYQETVEAKKEKFQTLAQKNAERSEASYNRAKQISSFIPLGQPILIGHHSERGHRADAKRIDASMSACVEANKKSNYYANKAQSVGKGGISSDNPDAVLLLEKKLAKLEARQEVMRNLNSYYRKHKTVKGFVCGETSISDEASEQMNKNIEASRSKKPFESYELSNNNQNISSIKKRLEVLKKVDTMEETEIQGEGFCIVVNNEENRVQILFDSIPDATLRKEMKGYGFKWSPRNKAWQRSKNPLSLRYAKKILNV